jgi:hypothetical protein
MKLTNRYTKKCKQAVIVAAAALTILSASSCRRDLWVYQDNFKQVELDIDWRSYFREWPLNPYKQPATDPSGMTVWFFPKDGRTSFRYTTDEVRHFETYLSRGEYDGLVVDYSPEEYGRQEFVGMDFANTAKVQSTASSYQPDSIPELYGTEAYAHLLPNKLANGLYQVAWEPEDIANDTIHMNVYTGEYDRYIPYKERDSYQSTLVHQLYNMKPYIIPWNMRIRIYIRGIYYLWKVQATVAGLADGYYLVNCKSSDTPCMVQLDDWELHLQSDSSSVTGGVGYIAKTFKTWGPMNFENRNWDPEVAQRPSENRVYEAGIPLNPFSYEQLNTRNADEIRINVKCLLRDRRTVKYFHFNVANLIHVFRNEYAMRIDLMDDGDDVPTLPYVEAVNGMQFDGFVVPWEEGASAQVPL